MLITVPFLPTHQKSFRQALTSLHKYIKVLDFQSTQEKQPDPGNIEGPPDVQISGTILEVVEHFPYLGSHLSQKATIEAEIHHSILYTVPAHHTGNCATEFSITINLRGRGER